MIGFTLFAQAWLSQYLGLLRYDLFYVIQYEYESGHSISYEIT